MNTGTVQIMWKEIIVGFIILYLLRGVLDVYMIKKYEKLRLYIKLKYLFRANLQNATHFIPAF